MNMDPRPSIRRPRFRIVSLSGTELLVVTRHQHRQRSDILDLCRRDAAVHREIIHHATLVTKNYTIAFWTRRLCNFWARITRTLDTTEEGW